MPDQQVDADVIIIGGGPAGAALGTLLAMDQHRVLILEKDIHPRDHVGESLTPSTNLVFDRLGFLDKMNDAGFIHKPGTGWNAPRSALWKFVEIHLFEFPLPGSPQPYTYNVERDVMDAMLLRHAHESGAKVLQGVQVKDVLFEDGRAAGVRVRAADGWERDLRAKIIVDASGRRCFLATKLGLKKKDANFNQFCIYSWFKGVKKPPPRLDGFTLFYFIGLNKAWSWHIPLRNDVSSMGVVVDKDDFQKSGKDTEEFFDSLVRRNRTFTHAMQDAERIRPWWIEGDYSYKIDTFSGPGWLMIGDALRFVDPIFSSGVDVALFSALYAYETITQAWTTGREPDAFAGYQSRVAAGIDIWYELIDTFYSLQNLVTRYATRSGWREQIVRTLQGNPYLPETQERARRLLDAMRSSFEQITSNPDNLLRPWGLDEVLRRNIEWNPDREPDPAAFRPCPTCGGKVEYQADEEVLVCGSCGMRASLKLSAAAAVPAGAK